MVRVEYVGKKPRKEDNAIAGTGIVWNGPGDVQEVPDKAVPLLLVHTDSFRLAEGQTVAVEMNGQQSAEVKPAEEKRSDDPPLVNLDTMTKSGLRDYAQRYFGENFHPNTGEEKMRQRIIGLMNNRT